MNDAFYKKNIDLMIEQFGDASVTLIRRKLKLDFSEALRLHTLYVRKPKVINNETETKDKKVLLNKYSCSSVSVPFLQKRLNLSAEETKDLLDDWRLMKKESDVYNKKFSEISKYLKPPKIQKKEKPLSETEKRLEKRTMNAITFLESIGYTVEKK